MKTKNKWVIAEVKYRVQAKPIKRVKKRRRSSEGQKGRGGISPASLANERKVWGKKCSPVKQKNGETRMLGKNCKQRRTRILSFLGGRGGKGQNKLGGRRTSEGDRGY